MGRREIGTLVTVAALVLGNGARSRAQDAEKFQQILQLKIQLQTELNEQRYGDAEKSALRMKALSDEMFAGQPLMQAAVLTNVGAVYESLFKLDQAEEIYNQVLTAFQAGGNDGANGVALTLNNLATLYQKQGRLADSERVLHRAVEMARNSTVAGKEIFLAKALIESRHPAFVRRTFTRSRVGSAGIAFVV